MNLTGEQIIGNHFSKKGSKTFQGIEAATGNVLPTHFHESTTEEVDEAIALAKIAFRALLKISDEQRAAFLEAISVEIMAIGDDLIDMAFF